MADPISRSGQLYADAPSLDWLAQLHSPHDDALQRAFDAADEGLPAIQVGPAEGRTLGLLLRLVRAQIVVELGTLAGYSAIWMARALPSEGRLYTVEYNEKHAAIARRNLNAAGVGDRVEIVVEDGPAGLSQVARSLDGAKVCAVFADADKGRYDVYAEWATQHLRPGGLLIGDNSFFFGRLLDATDDTAASMRRFHRHLAEHYDHSVCIPTPDGLAVGIKR